MADTTPLNEDPRWQKLMARGGLISFAIDAPDCWPHGPLAPGRKALEVGDDRLTQAYCTLEGHRFLRAHLLLPIRGARTVFGFETWGSLSEDSWQAWLAARAEGERFPGAFAWLANALPGFEADMPVPCNLVAGPAGALPRLQPQPGSAPATAQADGVTAAWLADTYARAGRDLGTLLDG